MACECCVSCGLARMLSASSDQTPGSFAKSWRNCECVCFMAKIPTQLRVPTFFHQPQATYIHSVCSEDVLLSFCSTVGFLELIQCCLASGGCTVFVINNFAKTSHFGVSFLNVVLNKVIVGTDLLSYMLFFLQRPVLQSSD